MILKVPFHYIINQNLLLFDGIVTMIKDKIGIFAFTEP